MVTARVPRTPTIARGCTVALKITLSRAGCRFHAGHQFRVMDLQGAHVRCVPAGSAVVVMLPLDQLELVKAVKEDTRKRDSIQSMLRSGQLIRGTQLRGN